MYGDNSNVILNKVERISSDWLDINTRYQGFKMPALIVQAPMSTLPEQKKSLKFSEKRKKLAEQKKTKKAKKQNLKGISPSREQLTSLFEHYQNGRFEDAEKLAVSIINEFPTYQFGWKVLGLVLKQTGRVSESLVPSQKSVQLAPQDAEAHFNLGITLQELGRSGEAEASYKKAIVLEPDADAHCNLGIVLQAQGRLDEAEASYTKAIALKSDFALAHSNLGNTLNELGRLDEAEASYTQAIALKPNLVEAHYNLGNTLNELDRFDEAEACYTQAITLKPDFAEAHYNIGTTLKELCRLEEAEASLRQAIALKPDYADAHYNLGNTLNELDRLDEAEACYTQAIALKPDFAEAHYNIGTTLKELCRVEEAEASLRQAIALKPDYADAYDHLGSILQVKEKFEDAEVCYIKCMSLEPNKTNPLTLSRGSILFRQGLFEQALNIFDKYDNVRSKANALESLYALGRVDDIYERIEARGNVDDGNIRVAAIAAFLSKREKKDTAHKFCNNPVDFIHLANLSSHIKDSKKFITSVIDELRPIKTKWELNTTQNGFQANIDVFKNPLKKMSVLKSIIMDELDTYYSKFKNETCTYIKQWPSKKNITGWHVILKQQGHQTAHIHPSGWLSGVIYLMTVPSLGKNEGAIEFSLDSPLYHDVDSSKKIYQPKLGDIVFFPSSLHHRTLPFSTDMDRICISFDLIPASGRH